MEILALVADEAAGEAVASRLSFLVLVAFGFGRSVHLADDVSDGEQVVHEEGSLQARDFVLWETAGLAAVGALDGQVLHALAR